ncbi:MAG TPA: DnaB-like helicase C-terminal domain-containing protein [Bacteroidales bacterium]|nr:DnaB-like helicase C-terminal domain-containing protein [Bacteroidales bacterium]
MIATTDILKAEQTLLAYILNDRAVYLEHNKELHENLFSDESHHRSIFRAYKQQMDEGGKTDVFTIASKVGMSAEVLSQLVASCEWFADVEALIDSLHQHYIRQSVNRLASFIIASKNSDGDELLTILEDGLKEIRSGGTVSFLTLLDTVKDVFRQIDLNASGNKLTGIPYGLKWLDNFTGGMHGGDLVVIAGRTSQGKTSMALSCAYTAAMTGHNVGIWSLEMTDIQITARLMSFASDVPAKDILYNKLDMRDIDALNSRIGDIITKGIFLPQGVTAKVSEIMNTIRLLKLHQGLSLAIVDYLQLTTTGEKISREQDMAKAARQFKNLAKELNIPIILISQLHRTSEKDQRPALHHLRDSGQIEEAADVILLVYRPEVYGIEMIDFHGTEYSTGGLAMIDLVKGRNVGVLDGLAHFNRDTTHFTEHSEKEVIQTPIF